MMCKPNGITLIHAVTGKVKAIIPILEITIMNRAILMTYKITFIYEDYVHCEINSLDY